MIKGFPITFVQTTLEQTLLKNHIDNPNLVGGKDQVQIHSFYEQLKGQDEVDRFVETFRDLTEQQNRMGLIANGILMSPDNPTITNLYSTMIIPMTWATSMRVKLSDRDLMLETINELIEELKGSKVDIAELKCRDDQGRAIYVPFAVGTIGHNFLAPQISSGDFLGTIAGVDLATNTDIQYLITQLASKGISDYVPNNGYVYISNLGTIKVAQKGFNQDFGIEDVVLDDIFYDELTPNTRTVNGYVTFKSIDTVGAIPSAFTDFYCDFWFWVDYQHTSEIKYNRPLTIKMDSLSINGSGYLVGRADFSFEVNESEVDFDSGAGIDTIEQTTDPKTFGYEIVTSGDNIIFPPEHESFEKYKLSMSFEGLRCDTPRTLNGDEYCEISFGGSATLVSERVKLGNDLVKVSFKKNKLLAQTPITFTYSPTYYLEPLEMPSGNGANTLPNQLVSNAFKVNSHTDSMTLSIQYTFILDESIDFFYYLYQYGRYGITGTGYYQISPNVIYDVVEYWSYWGHIDKEQYLGKLAESVDIENTESDTMTISITMQIQGENN